ncbi:MAG: c-type cytochrome [Myxococcota bacterium]|nr:c-type cytochrome [Myxococcota bacterium]
MSWLLPVASAAEVANSALEYGVCISCHGPHGEGRPAMGAPRIGDLEAAHVSAQLHAFRDGVRGGRPDDAHGQPMRGIARGMDDAQIERISAYVAALEPRPLADTAGPEVAPQAYAACGGCHGADARGTAALGAPSLLYQDADYLARQLVAFRDGFRGGEGAPAMSMQMAAVSGGLTDADIASLVSAISGLRPALPARDSPEITLEPAEGLAAFADIYAVATHPRCMNCHPSGDVPLQTDESTPHSMGITRFSPLQGQHCSTCHAGVAVGDGLTPLPPADPAWSMPPKSMAFEDRTIRALCEQLKDPEQNGGRGLNDLTRHAAEDHLLLTSWHAGRTPPPISHPALVERFTTWAAAGAPCPE